MQEADVIFVTIVGALVSAGIGGLAWWIRMKICRLTQHYEDVANLKKAVWRLNKTVLILTKIIDDIAEKTHPEFTSDLEEIARELLTSNDYYEEEKAKDT